MPSEIAVGGNDLTFAASKPSLYSVYFTGEIMIISGLHCSRCGDTVLDGSEAACSCGQAYSEDVMAIKRLHHSEKMKNVAKLKAGTMTLGEALAALPRVIQDSQ